MADNPPVQIYINKIKNKIAFKITTGCKLELLSFETMKLLGSSKKDVGQNKAGEDLPKLESSEVVAVKCNLVNNNYQQAYKVLFTFVPNKQFGRLVTIHIIHQQCQKLLMQNFNLLKYGLQTKKIDHLK